MNDRLKAAALAGAILASSLAGAGAYLPAAASDAAPDASPVVAGCANPNLPREILDGTFAGKPSAPLPVVDADAPGLELRLAVARNEADREQGLMCVTRLRPHHGMLFVFSTSRQLGFWMKNTLVPLDMVWLAADGTITAIASEVPASTRTTADNDVARRSGMGIFVIELPSGEASSDTLKVGERLLLPPLHASQ